jgi:DNA-binding winged helix-turn-helix (wHTH) protein
MNLSFGQYEFDRDAMSLTRAGRVIPLDGKPLELLALLLEKPGIAVTREDIRRRLWPEGDVDFDPTLSLTVNRLRAALGHEPYIEEVPRIGYRFKSATMAPRMMSRRTHKRRPARIVILLFIAAIAALAIAHYFDRLAALFSTLIR